MKLSLSCVAGIGTLKCRLRFILMRFMGWGYLNQVKTGS